MSSPLPSKLSRLSPLRGDEKSLFLQLERRDRRLVREVVYEMDPTRIEVWTRLGVEIWGRLVTEELSNG